MAAPTSGITKLRNTIDSKMNDSTTTRAMKSGQLGRQHVGEVHEDGGVAPDEDLHPAVAHGLGDGHRHAGDR